MRITLTDRLSGVPMAQIRKALRHLPSGNWSVEHLQARLELSGNRAIEVADALVNHGFATKALASEGIALFATTTKGLALGYARGSAPIRRKTAKRLLNEFLERVRIVNASPDYLYTVRTVVLFGSYLSDSDDLGDIDIAYVLERRSMANWKEAATASILAAERAGRRFRNAFERACWPETEVIRFLHSHCRYLQLIHLESQREFVMGVNHQVLIGTFP